MSLRVAASSSSMASLAAEACSMTRASCFGGIACAAAWSAASSARSFWFCSSSAALFWASAFGGLAVRLDLLAGERLPDGGVLARLRRALLRR